MAVSKRAIPLACVLLALFALAVACSGGETKPEKPQPTFLLTPLLVASRTSISLCVDGLGGSVADADDVEKVKAALDAGLGEYQDLPGEFGSTSVTLGCPPSRVPLGERTGGPSAYGRSVDTPSEHFAFVYVLPEITFRDTFPSDETYSLGLSEHVCGGSDSCDGVTYGLYLPAGFQADVIEYALLDALGLVPGTPMIEPELTPGFEAQDGIYYPPTPSPTPDD